MVYDLLINKEGHPCYNIHIRSDFSDLPSLFQSDTEKKYDNLCIVTDTNVAPLYAEQIKSLLDVISCPIHTFIFQAGESSKNLSTVQDLYEFLIQHHFTRHSLLIALGGGVVGDLTGFAASTYMRGIDFIQVPTTLLSQVDSSIGGKTGVDFNQYKNMVGAFYMPKMVYINTGALTTLDSYNFACGMGEVIKSALIQNKDFYFWLKDNVNAVKSLDIDTISTMIYECCKIKGYVVEIDPTEQGIRAYLNYGHTLGHAIEKLSNFKLGHGQCVGLGMICANYLSAQLGYLTADEVNNINDLCASYDLPAKVEDINASDILAASKSDKKMKAGKVKFIILKGIGQADIYEDFTDSDLLKAIEKVL